MSFFYYYCFKVTLFLYLCLVKTSGLKHIKEVFFYKQENMKGCSTILFIKTGITSRKATVELVLER